MKRHAKGMEASGVAGIDPCPDASFAEFILSEIEGLLSMALETSLEASPTLCACVSWKGKAWKIVLPPVCGGELLF